jgi:hypothetical protein
MTSEIIRSRNPARSRAWPRRGPPCFCPTKRPRSASSASSTANIRNKTRGGPITRQRCGFGLLFVSVMFHVGLGSLRRVVTGVVMVAGR